MKRQKEQQRRARAEQKREARNARRAGSGAHDDVPTDVETSTDSAESVEITESAESNHDDGRKLREGMTPDPK